MQILTGLDDEYVDQTPARVHMRKLISRGVEKATRELYLFAKPEEYKNDNYGKLVPAILINSSVISGDERINDANAAGVTKKLTKFIELNVYNFNVNFVYPKLSMINDAAFTLFSSYGTGAFTDMANKNTYPIDLSITSTRPNFNEDPIIDGWAIVPPQYYNPEDMEGSVGDYCDIRLEPWYASHYMGYDIIDPLTKIKVLDQAKWFAMDNLFKDRLVRATQFNTKYYQNNVWDASILDGKSRTEADVINDLFADVAMGMIDGALFCYDTDKGVYWTGGRVINAEFQTKSKIGRDIGILVDGLKEQAKEIEKTHGPVRINYVPKLFGDNIQIFCKDYARSTQPFMTGKTESTTSKISVLENVVDEAIDRTIKDSGFS